MPAFDPGQIRAMLFDFDGVVVQSENVYDQATRRLGQSFGIEVPASFADEHRGIGEEAFYQHFKASFHIDLDLESLWSRGTEFLWEAFADSVHFTEGFEDFFARVRRRFDRVALVTATPRELLNQIFQQSGITLDFDRIITASDVEKTKPAAEPYLKACHLLQVAPGQALAIEDSPTGLRSAIAAGCQTIGITTSCSRESLKEANLVVDSFAELEELLTIV